MTGRPSDYTQEKADQICAYITEGKSLRTIQKIDGMPSAVTIFAWLRKEPMFLKLYAQAKEEQAEMMVEDILEICDDGSNDWMERNGKSVLNGEHVQRSKLRVDTRKWLASKLKAKKYGDSSQVKITGDTENPFVLKDISNKPLEATSDEWLANVKKDNPDG